MAVCIRMLEKGSVVKDVGRRCVMKVLICLFFPPIIAVWLCSYFGKEKQKKIQLCLQYILAVLVVNSLCFWVKCVLMKGGMGYLTLLLTDIPVLSAVKFLVMALAISVAYAAAALGIQRFLLPYIKRQFEVVTVRKILGLFFGAFFFVIFSVAYRKTFLGLLCFLAFVISGFLTCRPKKNFWKYTILALHTAAVVPVLLLFPFYEIFAEDIWEFLDMYTPGMVFVYNGLLLMLAVTLLNSVIHSWKACTGIVAAVCSILTVINGYTYRFRGKEFVFPDVFSAVTAGNVAQNYDLRMQYHTFTVLALLTVLVFLVFSFDLGRPERKLRRSVLSLAVSAVLLLCFNLATKDVSIITWKWDGTLINGYYLNFYISARDYFVKKPEHYSDAYMEELEAEYITEKQGESSEKPNILVVMSESYADFAVLGSEPDTNVAVAPFWNGLEENTVKGTALTSVFGGSTANAEFEFLTGFTMYFLPDGAIPYQQYIHKDTFSLAHLLDSYGYRCVSTHPYKANGWNRLAVYPRLGFRKSTFEEAYPHEKLMRAYVSDQEMFEYILAELKEESDLPLFLFGITMQNHGGYETRYDNFTPTVHLEGYDRPYPDAETYLSLLNQSDKAMEYLLTELAEFEEDTVVLFFGDHFPQIEQEFYEELYGGPFDTLDSQMKQYTVPFLIWANFDIEERTVECTSLNYLGRYLLEVVGLELPPFYRFLKEMEQHVPAINGMGYYSREAGAYLRSERPDPEEAAWIEKYEILQYNGLHDKKNISSAFFGDYVRKENE